MLLKTYVCKKNNKKLSKYYLVFFQCKNVYNSTIFYSDKH